MNGLSHCYNFVYADEIISPLFRKPDGVDTDDWHTELFWVRLSVSLMSKEEMMTASALRFTGIEEKKSRL